MFAPTASILRGRNRGGARLACVVCALAIVASVAPPTSAVAGHGVRRRVRPDALGYKLGPGPWPVGVVDRLALKDPQRHRTIEVTVRYPRARGRAGSAWPLIVFSHGAGGSRAAFPELTAHWASHGYVVVIPTHADSAAALAGRHQPPRRAFDVDQLDRLADVVFVLDSLDQIEKKMAGFHGRRAMHVDRDRIGIAGHSAGALTAQMAIGVKVRVSRPNGETELKSVGDARFKAAILISAQGTINRLLTRDSWSELARPLMVITGSRDVVPASRETPESRQDPFQLARPGHKFLVFIEGATHSSYAGRVGPTDTDDAGVSDSDLRMITGVTASATLAFWDAYLANDERGQDYLASDDLAKYSGGKASLKRK